MIILAIPLVLLWLMVSRGRKQQREMLATQDSVTPGTQIMTTSGLYAEVVEVDGEAIVLEIAPGVRTRWTKRAIGQVVSTPVPEAAESADADEDVRAEDVRSEAGYAAPENTDADGGPTSR
nr:preprotein translocase subunit YajC [Kineosporia babensis]